MTAGPILFCKYDEVCLRRLAARGAAFTVVLDGWDRTFGGVDEEVLAAADRVLDVTDFDSLDELAAVAWELSGTRFAAVASFAEFSQYGAGFLADALGVPGLDGGLALRTRDKRAMKQAVAAAGVPTADFVSIPWPVPPGTAELIAGRLGFPVVVKPANGMGAIRTSRVPDAAALAAVLADGEVPPPLHSRHRSAERFTAGAEHHVDAVWSGGEPLAFVVGAYPRPRLGARPGEEGSTLLRREDEPDLYDLAEALHRRVNAALGIRDQATHLEFFLDPGRPEPVFSEVATRFGGGPLLDMVRIRDGVDLREVWVDALVGAPDPGRPGTAPGPHTVAGINIPPDGPGRVVELPDPAALAADPRVLHHEVGVAVGEEPHGPWTLMLVLGAPDRAAMDRVVADVRREYRIRTDGPAPVR